MPIRSRSRGFVFTTNLQQDAPYKADTKDVAFQGYEGECVEWRSDAVLEKSSKHH